MATATRTSIKPKITFTKGQQEPTVLSNVEQMISLFLELDSNKDGSVTRDELVKFYESHKLNKSQIDEWMSRFDTDSDGKITLEEFSKALGLDLDDLKMEKVQLQNQRTSKKTEINVDGVEMLCTTMPVERQEVVVKKFKELLQSVSGNENRMNEVNDKLKAFLDEKYGRIWQCITLTGSYWMRFSHEPFMSIQFKYQDKYICIAWRTHRV
ncbi:Tegumental calcium-binding EF-hand protein 3 [Fasciola hepatica]|uniref:CaBP3 n=2 Tax=Fasciola TaxID=6191 RepID=K7WKP9_FASHE|nr:CaBP3 [Fasciola hepatica]THD25976.1 Tegumental calcium-binding EF-hand protein 3 [Fasciola hepatica]